jgi:hypothetical protein
MTDVVIASAARTALCSHEKSLVAGAGTAMLLGRE